MNNKKTWVEGEVRAADYLKKCGYKILETNFRISGVELDIIALLPRKVRKKEIITEFKKRKFQNKKEKKLYKSAVMTELKTLNDLLVFVEVKARTSKKFGEPFEAVGDTKQHNIERGALAYSKRYNAKNMPIRIDVLSVIDDNIEHIKCAFDSTY